MPQSPDPQHGPDRDASDDASGNATEVADDRWAPIGGRLSADGQVGRRGSDRRRYRRHAMGSRHLAVERIDPETGDARPLGEIVNLSAGGIALRTTDRGVVDAGRLHVRLRLPSYAGLAPFIDDRGGPGSARPAARPVGGTHPSVAGRIGSRHATRHGTRLRPTTEWVGWLDVVRVSRAPSMAGDAEPTYEVAGRLLDMDEIDRGMLGLYLSTQPLAA